MSKHVVYIPDDMHDYDELFVGNMRAEQELICCGECRYFGEKMQSGYYSCGNIRGCVKTVPEGFCGWAVRKLDSVCDDYTILPYVQPAIDAEPVQHGKWIYGNDFHWYTASCSACGYQRRTDIKATRWNQWKYCPHCGAKMDN